MSGVALIYRSRAGMQEMFKVVQNVPGWEGKCMR
jgi:hypothetical protein